MIKISENLTPEKSPKDPKVWLLNHYTAYKTQILSVLILVAIMIFGVRTIEHHRVYLDLQATKNFQNLLLAMSMQDDLTAKTHAKELLNYADRTPYPRLAGILLAKLWILENDLPAAAELLQTIGKRSKTHDQIWHMANLRLAKILLWQNKLDLMQQAIEQGIKGGQFVTLYKELSGDLLVAKQELAKANKEYLAAFQALPAGVLAPWLEIKVAETTAAAEAGELGEAGTNT